MASIVRAPYAARQAGGPIKPARIIAIHRSVCLSVRLFICLSTGQSRNNGAGRHHVVTV